MTINTFITFIIAFLLSFFTVSPLAIGESGAVSLIIESNATQINLGLEVEMRLSVLARESINAFDIALKFPSENLKLVRASTAGSIVSIWQSLPSSGDKNDIVRLVGGITPPFSGENGEIVTLVFRAKTLDDIVFTIPRAD